PHPPPLRARWMAGDDRHRPILDPGRDVDRDRPRHLLRGLHHLDEDRPVTTTLRPSRRLAGLARPSGRRTGLFLGLFVIVVLLCLVGLVMVMSASSVVGLYQFGSSWYFVKRQLIWLVVGLAVLLVTMRIDYHLWRRIAGPLL